MAKLIYFMVTSLDGHTEDERGRFGWGVAAEEELHNDMEVVSTFGASPVTCGLISNSLRSGGCAGA